MKSWMCAARAAASICSRAELAAHGDVLARRRRQQERLLRHHADARAEVLLADGLDRRAVDADRARRRRIEAQQQRQQRGLAAAGVADDAVETAGGDLQVQPVQDGMAGLVREIQPLDRDGALGHAPVVRRRRRFRFLQQRLDARRPHHRLLQLRELHRDLRQRLDHARDVVHEGIEDAHLHRTQRAAVAAQAEHPDHHRQQQHVEEVQQRTQQPGVGAQLALPRAVVRPR